MKEDKRKMLGNAILRLVHKGAGEGQEEAENIDGGFTVAQDIYPEILSPNFAEGSLYADCKIINVSDNKTGLKIPVTDTTTISKTNIRGGYRAYVVAEGAEKSANSGSFALLDLVLKKEAVVIYATDELLQDSSAIASYLNSSAEQAILGLTDDSIINGNGLMVPIVSHPCTGSVSCTDPVSLAELHNFFDAYYGGKNGKWYVSKVRFGQIMDLYETAATGSLLLTASEGTYYLWGYPIIVVNTMLDNEMLLADLTQYIIIQKPLATAVNQSLKWLEDETAFRFVLRITGSPLWPGPVTLADGSMVHPFVMTTGMEQSSSSSISSESSSSYSSSSSSSYIENWSSSSSLSSSSKSSVSSASSVSLSSASSSSLSTVSNSSLSSVSISSLSTVSSTSLSSESSESSLSNSSASSASISSVSISSESSLSNSSVSSESSSSDNVLGCKVAYCGDFTTAAYDGSYVWDEVSTWGGKAVYSNGTYLIWYDPITGYWALSNDAGDPQNQWLSSKDDAGGCPDGAWVGEVGAVVVGEC